MKPMDVLVAATRTGARFFRRERDLGTIEAGKLADLVIVDGDPLADIRATRNVVHIVANGKLLDPAEIRKLPTPQPRERD